MYMAFNALTNFMIWKNQKIQLNGATTIIAGDSHPMSSLNPQLLHNAINISQSAEPYVLTYWKLKEITKTHNIDTIILGFAPHNIYGFNDLKFSDKFWSSEMFRRSYYIGEFSTIKNCIEIDKNELIKIFIKNTCLFPKLNHINYIGKFNSSKDSKLSDIASAINRHYYFKNVQLGVSQTSIIYLNKILNICKRKNIEIILISNPVHLSYFEKIPKKIIEKYYDLKKLISLKGIFVFDKTNSFYHDSLYSNADHLNYYGAINFTNEYKKTISSH